MKKKHLTISVIAIGIIAVIISYFLNYNKNSDTELINNITQINDNDIILGNPNAKATIVLYFDYNCKYCNKFFENVYPELKSNFLDKDLATLILRPVCKSNDIAATKAYQTVICINKFGQFDKLHRLLLHEPKIIYTKHFQQLIDDYINTNANVAECILNSDDEAIKKNIFQFQQLKTKGTPTFVINNKVIIGYKNYHFFEEELKNIINEY